MRMDLLYIICLCPDRASLCRNQLSPDRRRAPGDEVMQKIAAAIHLGAMTYLKRQYTAIAVFVVSLR